MFNSNNFVSYSHLSSVIISKILAFLLYFFTFFIFLIDSTGVDGLSDENNDNTTTIVLKYNEWVIGHVSLKTKKERTEILHLFVDSKYRKKGLGSILLKEIENYRNDLKIDSIAAKVQKKNIAFKKVLERSGYRYKNSNQNLMVKKLD